MGSLQESLPLFPPASVNTNLCHSPFPLLFLSFSFSFFTPSFLPALPSSLPSFLFSLPLSSGIHLLTLGVDCFIPRLCMEHLLKEITVEVAGEVSGAQRILSCHGTTCFNSCHDFSPHILFNYDTVQRPKAPNIENER